MLIVKLGGQSRVMQGTLREYAARLTAAEQAAAAARQQAEAQAARAVVRHFHDTNRCIAWDFPTCLFIGYHLCVVVICTRRTLDWLSPTGAGGDHGIAHQRTY